MPEAPPRLSITSVLPSTFSRLGCSNLSATSVAPPGANGTMTWIGLSG